MDRLVEDSLQIARDAITHGAWAEAFDLLVKADRTGPLGPSELEILAEAALVMVAKATMPVQRQLIVRLRSTTFSPFRRPRAAR